MQGGPLGFMLSTNVAEVDVQHAATLLRCARELLHVVGQASGVAGGEGREGGREDLLQACGRCTAAACIYHVY